MLTDRTREASMPVDRTKHDKHAVLRQHAMLNPRPGGVTHARFEASEFFDPHDLLQVKYEMLRLVNVDKRPISEAAKACGFSRPSFYQAQAAFEQSGLAGLIPHKPGPRGGHKLTPAVMQFVTEARVADPGVRAERLASWVRQRFGLQVHPRSIERQLLRKKKPR
jgi:transposase